MPFSVLATLTLTTTYANGRAEPELRTSLELAHIPSFKYNLANLAQ